MAATLILRDGVGTPVTSVSFSEVQPGTTSPAQAFQLYNPSAEEAPAPRLDVALPAAVPSATEQRAFEERWLQVATLGTGTAPAHLARGPEPIGEGRPFFLPVAIPAGTYVDIELTYHPLAGDSDVALTLRVDPGTYATPVDVGQSEGGRNGVVSGLGDTAISEAWYESGDFTFSGTDVTHADTVGVVQGVEFSMLTATTTVNATAADGPLGAGEEYAFRFYYELDSSGAVVRSIAKSNKGLAAEIDTSDIPAVPAGAVDAGGGIRDQTGVTLVVQPEEPRRFFASGGASLSLSLSAGRLRFGNRYIVHPTPTVLGLSANSTCRVWHLPNDQWQVTVDDPLPPAPGAILLYEQPTSTSTFDPTLRVDSRDFIGTEARPLQFHWPGTVSDLAKAYASVPAGRESFLRVPRGLWFALGSPGSGNTQGVVAVDLELSDGAGGWNTVFVSQGTDDRRPQIPYNRTEPVDNDDRRHGAGEALRLPEVVRLPSGRQLRATLHVLTVYDGTAPSDASLIFLAEVP